MKKIVAVQNLGILPDQIERLESLGEFANYIDKPASEEEWFNRVKDADIICAGMFGMKSEFVYQLRDAFISLPYVGVEFLDMERLHAKNVVVSNSPGCNKEAVAEWMMGMLILSLRNLCSVCRVSETLVDEGGWKGKGVWGKHVTVLGAGNIGKEFGKYCEAFGAHVTYFKRGDDLLESVKDADIVANCLGANDSTKGLLDSAFFSSLKKGSFFISAARSMTYDIDALKKAIDDGILIGAADDTASAPVGDAEHPDYQKLLAHPKINVTPHMAWSSDIEARKGNDMMIDNIEAWLAGKPIHVVT